MNQSYLEDYPSGSLYVDVKRKEDQWRGAWRRVFFIRSSAFCAFRERWSWLEPKLKLSAQAHPREAGRSEKLQGPGLTLENRLREEKDL